MKAKEKGMAMDRKRSLLQDLKQTLKDEFAKKLVEAYAESFDYTALEKAFVGQLERLIKETSNKDEA